jgi:hypothetical protein
MPDPRRDKQGRLLPGVSLNPAGRPRTTPDMPRHLKRAMLAELTDEKLRALLAAHIERGIAGSVSSARLVLEYAVGKPRERVDVDVTARGALWQFIQEVRTARDDPQVIEATAPDDPPLSG